MTDSRGMKRNIIIIGGGSLQVPLIETAVAMGLSPIVFDMDPRAPGSVHARPFIKMSTRDIEGCVREAKILRSQMVIHGVITAGTDASRAVSAIAAALDLPGIRYSDAEAASNKVLMRKRLRNAGVPVPDFAPVWNLRDAREALDELGVPAVLKPAENMGARGVILVRNRDELAQAYRHAKRYSTTGEMILEQYMDGPELSVDALAFDGKVRITGIADRIIDSEPYFIERGHNMPSALPLETLHHVEEVMRAGMKALGINFGAGKGDIKVTSTGAKIGELAARLSGGWMSSHTFPLHSGVNLLKSAIQVALGERPTDLEPSRNRVVVERGLFSRPGKILRMAGQEDMESIPGVETVILTRAPGAIMREVTSNIDKVGHIIASGRTLAEAEEAAEKARALFEIEVDETGGIEWENVEERARARLGSVCWVCNVCDGENCASGVPGMGGAGSDRSFRDNYRALQEWKIVPGFLRKEVSPDPGFVFMGRHMEHPIMGAPMTGAGTNLSDALSEKELGLGLLKSYREAGSVAWLGDGASLEKFPIILDIIEALDGFGVLICKPRSDTEEIIQRMKAAVDRGILAVGMDIDAVAFKTMKLRGQTGRARTIDEILAIREHVPVPFILKGVLDPADAALAAKAGIDCIVVSNHGGRVLDDAPGAARVLPEVRQAWLAAGGRPEGLLADGGVRSGADAFRYLALGARAVLVGRPSVIALAGGGEAALRFMIQQYARELKETMNLCGCETLSDIRASHVSRIQGASGDRSPSASPAHE